MAGELPTPPKLDNYRGFYFVNYNPKAISLSDFLAGAKDAIDSYCDQAADGEDGLYVLKGEHAYSIRSNYKFLVENSYDGYHVIPTHISFLDYLRDRAAGTAQEQVVADVANVFRDKGKLTCLGNGHAVLSSWVPTGRPVAYWIDRWGPEVKHHIDANRARLVERYGEERATYLAEMQKNLVIFPNLVFNDNVGLTIRNIEPVGPDQIHVRAWGFAHKGEDAELLKIRLDNFNNFLGLQVSAPQTISKCWNFARPVSSTARLNGLSFRKAWTPRHHLRLQTGAPDDECQMQAYWTQWDRTMRVLIRLSRNKGGTHVNEKRIT